MDCNYPDCLNCKLDDCVMEQQDIHNLLKRRRWSANPEAYRKKQQAYRNQVKEYLPHCDECKECILVRKERNNDLQRLCTAELKLIERKVANSPTWCPKRLSKQERDHQRYLKRKEAKQSAERKEAV